MADSRTTEFNHSDKIVEPTDTTSVTKSTTSRLLFFYCDQHDDCFCVKASFEQDPYELKWQARSCTQKQTCDLSYIGDRVYDCTGALIEDNTPCQEYFDRRAGGYEKDYMDSTDEIVLDE
ncbi:hypothetical protein YASMINEVIRUS_113 [Yasminevirus sp. GU-2018]|uniref:Uncharacterized protein n=1 Tax=Yasminevirus sp. GU-2018 TaxID=2420051 RepID=A0A5K0U765_9VIRU|nr:hypothetical protein YASMINEVIRUS_113 [Yasminevirus sp. GU-2018]